MAVVQNCYSSSSFPFGGMENTLLTFANPTIAIIGQICGLMKDFVSSQREKDFLFVNSQVGNKEMNSLIKKFNGSKDEAVISYASLHPITKAHHADDSFSTIPYERGYQLLFYLESQITEAKFQKLLKDWFKAYEYQSADQNDFYNFMIAWIKKEFTIKNSQKSNKLLIKYDLLQLDVPPVKLTFSNHWVAARPGDVPQDYLTFFEFKSNQKQLFLSYLLEKAASLDQITMVQLDNQYELSNNRNAELLFRWYTLAIQTKYVTVDTNLQLIRSFVGKVGRMQMVNQIYKALNKATAQTWYQENYKFYHLLTRQSIERIISQKEENNVNVELL